MSKNLFQYYRWTEAGNGVRYVFAGMMLCTILSPLKHLQVDCRLGQLVRYPTKIPRQASLARPPFISVANFHMRSMLDPDSPPAITSTEKLGTPKIDAPSKPMIPATIGLFTYGSSSPYALVLCLEHYFDSSIRPKPISTHFAALLAILGSFVWFSMNLAFLPQAIGVFAGQPLGMYGQAGVACLAATAVFLVWACWRFVRHFRANSEGNETDANL